VSDSYLGAAEGGRPGAPLARRLWALQRSAAAVPAPAPAAADRVHPGPRRLARDPEASRSQRAADLYRWVRRSQAAGIGGNNASFAPLPGAVWMIRAAVEGTPTTRAVTRILITCPAPPMPCGMAATRFAGSPTAG